MLKVGSKRRRTKGELLQEKEEAKIKNDAINDKMAQFDQMQQQFQAMEQRLAEGAIAKAELDRLMAVGDAF